MGLYAEVVRCPYIRSSALERTKAGEGWSHFLYSVNSTQWFGSFYDIMLTPAIDCSEKVGCKERPTRCWQLRACRRLAGIEMIEDSNIPHINVKVLREICSQASCRRRSSDWAHPKVIGIVPLHAQVFKIECPWTKPAGTRQVRVSMCRIEVLSSPCWHNRS
jgi:hypothetical protein